jgi:MerR family transcriptional regulator, heat shock protein HspR
MSAGDPLFTVGQVATLLDVEQAFLRRLDSHDVVSPVRSGGGQRRYSHDDMDRVQAALVLIDEGVTLVGVRHVLALRAEVASLRAEVSALRAGAGPSADRG